MFLLGPLAALLGVELDSLIGRIKRSAVAYGAMALLGVIALVFLLVAIDVALSWWLGPLWAAVIIAVLAAGAALIVFLSAQAAERKRQEAEAERRRAAQATALASTAAMGALPLLKRHPWVAAALLPVGAAAGYAWYIFRSRNGHKR